MACQEPGPAAGAALEKAALEHVASVKTLTTTSAAPPHSDLDASPGTNRVCVIVGRE
jgi:hypothetical protein